MYKKEITYSFLIPNIGFDQYLCECIKSILSLKNLNKYNHEIIICDQSDVETHQKIQKYINDLNNNIQIFHCAIKSLLNARYELMKKASKDYVIFIDSDDVFSDDFLDLLSKNIINNNYPDILIHNLVPFKDKEIILSDILYYNGAAEDLLDYFKFGDSLNSVGMKCFKRNLYNRDDYWTHEITNGEDKFFSYPLMKKAKNIIYCRDICCYLYRQRESSMVHTLNINKMINAFNNFNNYDLPKTKKQKIIYTNSHFRYLIACLYALKKQNRFYNSDVKELFIIHKKTSKNKLSNSIKVKAKYRLLNLLINLHLYRMIFMLID